MQLSTQIYKFLVESKIIQQEDVNNLKNGKVMLSKNQQSLIENGYVVGQIVKQIEIAQNRKKMNFPQQIKLDQLKEISTASTKLYNWNIIIECLNNLTISHSITPEIKQHLLMGDVQLLEEIVTEVYSQLNLLNESIVTVSSRQRTPSEQRKRSLRVRQLSLHNPPSMNNRPIETLQSSMEISNIQQLQPTKTIAASSTLEFLIQSLSKNLSLTIKQATALFAENNKYLALIVGKGVQGAYEPIIGYLKEALQNSNILSQLIIKDLQSLPFTLSALKPGLVSKSQEVALLTIQLLLKIQQDLRSFRKQTYDWYLNEGLPITLLGLKRHPDLTDQLVELMFAYCRINFLDLFTKTLKQTTKTDIEFLQLIDSMFITISKKAEVKEELMTLGIINDWLEMCLKLSENPKIILVHDERVLILRFFAHIWRYYTVLIDQSEGRQNRILGIFKLHSGSKSIVISLSALTLIFNQVAKCSFDIQNVKKLTPVIIRLTLLVIENFDNLTVRHFMLLNFMNSFSINNNIPQTILCEAYIKHAQTQNYPCIVSLQFYNYLAGSSQLSIRASIQLLDLLSKITIYDIINYAPAIEIVVKILEKYLNDENNSESFIEFVNKFVKVSLSVYYSQRKQKNVKPTQLDNQRRGQILNSIKRIIKISEVTHPRIKLLVGHTNLQLPNDKGLNKILSLMGDPQEIMNTVQQEFLEHKQQQTKEQLEMKEEVKQVEKSMKKYGVSKSQQPKLTKLEQYHLASLRKPKNADPKVIEDLEMAKKNYQDKVFQEQSMLDKSQVMIKNQKEQLRKQLEKRSIEQGVAARNLHDVEVNLLYNDGEREKELQNEKKHGLIVFDLVDLAFEEDRDRLMVDILLRKYNKALRFLFYRYSNTCFSTKEVNSFDKMNLKKEMINKAEIKKMLNEFELDSRITMEEVQALFRGVQIQLMHNRTELKTLDFIGFQHFIVQLSIQLVQRPPINAKHEPAFQALQYLLNHLRLVLGSRKQSTVLFDDPDSQYFSQAEIIKEYNEQLKKTPDYILPEGFKKVSQLDLEFKYNLIQSLRLEESERVAYEIMNEIISSAFQINLIEPISEKVTIYKARPNIFGYIQSKVSEDNSSLFMNYDQLKYNLLYSQQIIREMEQKKLSDIEKRKVASAKIEGSKKRVLEIEPKRQLSMTMKMTIATYRYRDRAIVEQVAFVLEDIIYAVEHGKGSILRDKNIPNRIQEEKEKQRQQDLLSKEQKESRRKQHQEELRKKLEEERKSKEEARKQRDEEAKQDQLKKQKQFKEQEEARQQYLIEQKEKIKKEQQKVQEDVIQKQLDEKKSKIQELEQKKKDFREFNKQQIEQFKKEFEEDKKQKEKKVLEQKLLEEKKMLEVEKKRKQLIELEKQRKQIEKQKLEEIDIRYKQPGYVAVFTKYGNSLQYLFQFLIKITFKPIGKPVARDQITLKTFAWFANKFNFWPEIIAKQDITTIYSQITKAKKVLDHVPIGMDYEDFTQCLHRIAIKGKTIFNKIADKIKEQNGSINQGQMDQIVAKEGNPDILNKEDIELLEQNEEQEQQVKREDGQKELIQEQQQPIQQQQQEEQQEVELAEQGQQEGNPQESIKQVKKQKMKQKMNHFEDFYGNLDEVFCEIKIFNQYNERTLEAFILYLNLSEDKNKLELRFRQALEEGHIPNKMRLQNFTKRLEQN